MLNKNKYKLMQINMILFLIMFVFTFDFVNGQKTLRVELDDGHIRHNAVQNITELTFEDDACDGVRKVTYSGKIYTTVQIGNQCWFEQNLNLGTLPYRKYLFRNLLFYSTRKLFYPRTSQLHW